MSKISPAEVEQLRRSAVMSPEGQSVPVERDTLLALCEELERLKSEQR